MNPDHNKAYIQLHIAVFLFGLTAILGSVIEMSAFMIIWWRVLITSVSLLFFIQMGKNLNKLSTKTILRFSGIGLIIGLHWLCFYGSIKWSSSSITLICMSTTSFFVSIFEPLILRKRLEKSDLFLGLMIIPLMYIALSDIDQKFYLGAMVGILSALLAGIFSILNKKYISEAAPLEISFLELSSILVLFSAILPFYYFREPDLVILPPSFLDFVYLLILALLCTTLAWVLSIAALKSVSAFTSTLVINLEPIYGIILGAILLKEYKYLSPRFYIAGFFIVGLILAYPFVQNKLKNHGKY